MSGLRQASWYISAFLKKHKKILISSTLGSILLFLLLSQVSRFIPTIKRTTYIGRVGRFSLSQIPRDIQEKVSFGLTQVDETGEVSPALASSYTSEEGGKSYRFTIHPQIRWQDGKEVTPEDVNYSFSDVQTARSPNDIVYRLVAKSSRCQKTG
jgi:ABC-type transport system substrate-binding protein